MKLSKKLYLIFLYVIVTSLLVAILGDLLHVELHGKLLAKSIYRMIEKLTGIGLFILFLLLFEKELTE